MERTGDNNVVFSTPIELHIYDDGSDDDDDSIIDRR